MVREIGEEYRGIYPGFCCAVFITYCFTRTIDLLGKNVPSVTNLPAGRIS
jgi:hypothetical protein